MRLYFTCLSKIRKKNPADQRENKFETIPAATAKAPPVQRLSIRAGCFYVVLAFPREPPRPKLTESA